MQPVHTKWCLIRTNVDAVMDSKLHEWQLLVPFLWRRYRAQYIRHDSIGLFHLVVGLEMISVSMGNLLNTTDQRHDAKNSMLTRIPAQYYGQVIPCIWYTWSKNKNANYSLNILRHSFPYTKTTSPVRLLWSSGIANIKSKQARFKRSVSIDSVFNGALLGDASLMQFHCSQDQM